MYANQRFVLSHNMLSNTTASNERVERELQKLLGDMQLLWDPVSMTREQYTAFALPQPAPSQFLAFEQLVFRYNSIIDPLYVCVVAPAGHGKSTLIAAWLLWLYKHGARWEVAAATGIAAAAVACCCDLLHLPLHQHEGRPLSTP